LTGQKTTLQVTGMSCNHCKMAVEKALGGIEGVSEATVDLAAGTATVIHAPTITRNVLVEAVKKAGYQVKE